jgi:choline dehydrogenase
MGTVTQASVLVGLAGLLVAYNMLGVEDMLRVFIKRDLKPKYDYIIVGGGTAGAVLAGRLSEDASIKSILVIEAGDNPAKERTIPIDIPVLADAVRGTKFDWQYQTVPQKDACKAHVNNVCLLPSGKGLGGSSNLNYMQYQRGSRHDYDDWANSGATGWSYKDVLPYFIKSEDQRNGEFIRTVFHGFGGRMTVGDANPSAINKVMDLCFREVGLKKRDINGHNQFGWAPTQATIRRGVRWSTYRAFLQSAMDNKNLHVLTRAVAHKIIFDGKTAVGVEFEYKGKVLKVQAEKEIFLTAGAIGTPKILMLSGVGPKKHLQDMKIPVVADLPVGENLQDHVVGDGVEFFTPYTGLTVTAARAENFISSWAYSLFGTGMKSSPRFRESLANIRLRNQPPSIRYPLVSLHIASNPYSYLGEQLNVKEEAWEAVHGEPPTNEGFTIFPVLMHPRSKGTIRLKSNNPQDPPVIDPRYLSEEADVKMLAEAYLFARRLVHSKALKDWEFQLSNRLLPQCMKLGNFTDQYIQCHLRHITIPGNSPVGTCRIGGERDPHAVVDPNLRVRGLNNLRVIDASIIPNAMSGNSFTTQIMIAEKAADMIKGKDTVKAIRDYFKHLLETKHKRIVEDDEPADKGKHH